MKVDLLTNATVVDDAIRFVSEKGVTANAELKTHTDSIDKEKQQDNGITMNQVF